MRRNNGEVEKGLTCHDKERSEGIHKDEPHPSSLLMRHVEEVERSEKTLANEKFTPNLIIESY